MVRISGDALYQWDTGRYVTVTDITADHVHFSNKGDSKAVIMEIADSQSKIPDYLLQTGKQLCVYVVSNGVTVESKIFSVTYRERPEKYVYEEDQRNFIYELIASAENATEAANQAAVVAAQAGQSAGKSADRANAAAESAEKASVNANKAAVKASQTAKSLMVVGEAGGASIHLDDAIDQFLVGCRIFGKSTQLTTTGAQLIPMPYKTSGTSTNGVTFVEQADGGVKCVGTATASAYYTLFGGFAIEATPIPEWLVEGETYTISGGTSDLSVLLCLYKEDGTGKQFGGTPSFTFVMPTGYSYCGIFVLCLNGRTVSSTVYPMLNAGSTAANYEPYTGRTPSPNPNYPQEIVSTGDSGNITVNVTGENDVQSMTIATPNGLPGIRVASGGNYTDGNGQQWILDEDDFTRGVRITRLAVETISWPLQFSETADYAGRFAANGAVSATYKLGHAKSLSNFAIWRDWGYGKAGEDSFAISGRVLYYYPSTSMTTEEVNALFAEMIESKTPPIILAQLATPIETPLSEEEIAAYSALHTYRGHTTVSNDASAHMELEYVMDAKKYIDSLVGSSTIHQATVE